MKLSHQGKKILNITKWKKSNKCIFYIYQMYKPYYMGLVLWEQRWYIETPWLMWKGMQTFPHWRTTVPKIADWIQKQWMPDTQWVTYDGQSLIPRDVLPPTRTCRNLLTLKPILVPPQPHLENTSSVSDISLSVSQL